MYYRRRSNGYNRISEKANRMLAVAHNRRHDGNYRAIKEMVDIGVIGDVFHGEKSKGGFRNVEISH
ncbi:hypothetical protein FJZ31_03175 [Candidatus Poribacteria bacterium]|nr:hypothetical protein [Candidatus Poribacteria bacterium]